MPTTKNDISKIQACIQNTLDRKAIGKKQIVGIIGDAPSHYAKSPPIWNSVFQQLRLEAIYLPFDVEESRLAALLDTIKKSSHVMGANVTVPYKIKVIPFLDGLDEKAAQIKAVNTIVRTGDGRLIGYNTDGSGFIESLVSTAPGQTEPFLNTVQGMDVLLIGSGGSGRAVAFYLAELIGKGKLFISNRTPGTANSLAEEIFRSFRNGAAVAEEKIPKLAQRVGLIINCSVKGQGGIRKLPKGKMTILEPYSGLAPAQPVTYSDSDSVDPSFYRKWLAASQSDIEENNRRSLTISLSASPDTRFYDLIYHPLETVFLRHGRLSGHATMNGKVMNIAQAVDGFAEKICKGYLQDHGRLNARTRDRIYEIMSEAW